ncbi:type IV secretion system protein [Actinomadura parmotrematis]|uniref:Type IV secretion system protein n=1 Tax=Actinomadura parmotrematis TaxID=2864039 RepID=A0ABS7FNY9_9ACTN|nr:type IV secretion system protein [Actinomadura parmotrematis]MBW8481494.1 type IV secretion system protein [Actinomadura parmotrematis]
MKAPGHRTARLMRSPGEGLDPALIARERRRTARAARPARRPRTRRSVMLLLFMALFMVSPLSPASASIPLPSPSDACRPADSPSPEQYGSGTDGLIKPPDYPSAALAKTPVEKLTYYDRYGTAGQTWYAVDMGCSDAMAMMGNALANTTFTLVRAIDRTTISVYQAAASESLLGWLKGTVDDVIGGMGKTFGARYWTPVVIVGALWLAWWGLVRKRTSKVTEGVVWMVVAMVGLIWLISRPQDFTTLGTKVSGATSAAFNAALPQSDAKGSTCIPAPNNRPDPATAANVDPTTRNANGLWVALVCKPWLMGEFGTTDPNAAVVKNNADKLLWSQAVDLAETNGGGKVDLGKKSDAYKDVAADIKQNHAGAYPLFQGKNWTSRLAVAFGGLFAALVAGLLILVIAIALIVVKISFLLLLVAGPIFLGLGIHPGIGRVIAIRWLELLLSMLLKQAALIGVLSLLLWAYGLILGETLPWGLQILLIALVTAAAFIYRKPFQHLFSAVGYSAVGAREKGEAHLDKSVTEARKSTAGALGAVVPGAAGYRLGLRAGKRDAAAADADGTAGTTVAADRRGAIAPAGAGEGASPDAAPVLAAKPRGGAAAAQGRERRGAPPLNLPTRGGSLGRAPAADTTATTRPSAGAGAAGTGAAAGGGGSGVSRPTTWSGGRSSGGAPSGDAGGGESGGRGGWFSGRGDGGDGGGKSSGGGNPAGSGNGRGRGRARAGETPPARGQDGGKSAGKSSAPGKDPASGVPRPRTGNGGNGGSGGGEGGGAPAAGPGAGGRQAPPPLWGGSRRNGEAEPPIPFWLRPVDRAPGEGEREDR